LTDSEIAQRVREFLKWITDEEIPTLQKEMEKAKLGYEKDQRWDDKGHPDRGGYLDYISLELSKTKAIQKSLQSCLGADVP
jgi:hypothetical protein